jgi:inorganic pyrophosphatase
MNPIIDTGFWSTIENLLETQKLVIDRSIGAQHPRYPGQVYPLPYGYLEGTSAADGDGIDVWVGSLGERPLTGILCTFDTVKHDAEIKLLLGCAEKDIQTILDFHGKAMRMLYIPKPKESL